MDEDVADRATAVTKENALHVAETLRASEPLIAPKVAEGKLAVIAAYYDMESGKVTVLE